jgi:hypothetical protein
MMKRLGLKAVVAVPLFVAALVFLPALAPGLLDSTASAAVTRPGPPTNVRATYNAGTPGVSVSWNAPVSDGGSPIVYYLAFNYSGTHSCISPNPGPNACFIPGLKVGKISRPIRVRALSARGSGRIALVLPVVSQSAGNGGPPGSPAPGGGGGEQGSSPASSGAGSGTAATFDAADTTSGTDLPAELPFTGINLATLLVLGVGLVIAGWLILDPLGRRRAKFRRVPLQVLIGSRGHRGDSSGR